MKLARSVLTIGFGLLCLAARSFASAFVIYALGSYLVIDGLLELYGLYIRRTMSTHKVNPLDSAGGIASLFIGLLCFLLPYVTLHVLAAIMALLIIFKGLSQLPQSMQAQGRLRLLAWISSSLLVLLGLLLLIFPSYIMTFLVLFIGGYMLVAGSSLLLKERSQHIQSSSRPAAGSEPAEAPRDLAEQLPASTRRAIVFVRRAGANGLGHIGWGFEWSRKRFYVGSVENLTSKPFSRPDEMGFWCMQTPEPCATMHHRTYSYDEYKLFCVPEAHLKDAWKTLAWESQEPYSFVHHNCCDVAYEILHAYGSTEVLDPAQEYVPNDWYDALPGTSYSLAHYPPLPVSRNNQTQREITPAFLARMQREAPGWRFGLRRPWEELLLILMMMVGHLQSHLVPGFKRITGRSHRGASHP